MDASQSSLTHQQPVLPFFSGWKIPLPTVGISEDDWSNNSALSDSGTYHFYLDGVVSQCEMPEYFTRSYSGLWEWGVKSPFAETKFEPCQFDHMKRNALISTQTLDNRPEVDYDATTLENAYTSLNRFWADGVFVPLDWRAFTLLLSCRDLGEEKFLELVDQKYKHFRKITIVFADVIYGGCNSERLYLLWSFIRRKQGLEFGFKITQSEPVYHLGSGETFISVCIPHTAVEFPETKKDPVLFAPTQYRARSDSQQNHLSGMPVQKSKEIPDFKKLVVLHGGSVHGGR